jgi:SAM-dependent methyltransferase
LDKRSVDPQRRADKRAIRRLDEFLRYADETLDQIKLAELQQTSPPQTVEIKYVRTEEWLRKLWKPAVLLGLIDSEPKRILDIGTGPGHFPFICKYLGHDVIGLDRSSAFFTAMQQWMGVDTIISAVQPLLPLPKFDERFDIVTAFRIGFNVLPNRQSFGVPEWDYFLSDVRDNVLKDGGRLCLKFNVSANRERQFDDPEIAGLFARRGATFRDPGRFFDFNPLR